jgi:hypothetical protein
VKTSCSSDVLTGVNSSQNLKILAWLDNPTEAFHA